MIILNSKTIAKLPIKPGFTQDAVVKLCRDEKVYGYRENMPFSPWQIPADSFALYLRYNPALKSSFLEMTLKKGEEEMNIIQRTIRDFLNKEPKHSEEVYSISQLVDIFGIPENQLKCMLHQVTEVPFGIPLLAKCRQRFNVMQVLKILNENPGKLEALKDRHQMLLAEGDYRESMVRHLLMLYAYYKSNGYLL